MDMATNLFLLASPLGIERCLSHHLAEEGQIDVKVGLASTSLQEHPLDASYKTKLLRSISNLGKESSKITAKYPPKRRKGWFSRVACRAGTCPFSPLNLFIGEKRQTQQGEDGLEINTRTHSNIGITPEGVGMVTCSHLLMSFIHY